MSRITGNFRLADNTETTANEWASLVLSSDIYSIEEEVKARTTVINLAVSIGLTTLLSIVFSRTAFHLVENASIITLFCIASSVAYPICLRVTKAEIGYLRELLILVFVFVIAFGISELVYYSKMEPIHHDFGEALPILGFGFVWFGGIAVLSYSVVFLGLNLLLRSHPRS